MSSRLETKTSFGYMPLYIADYMADTAHLSTLEHGAYFLLIMAYWKTGKALPASDFRLANICHLSIDEWRGIRATIAEFFLVSSEFWTHKRIEKELQHFRDVSEIARKNRQAGIEKRKAEQAARQASFLPQPDNGRSTGVERPPMLDARSTGVVDINLQNSVTLLESTNSSTGVERALNGRPTTQTQTQTHISNTEVLETGRSISQDSTEEPHAAAEPNASGSSGNGHRNGNGVPTKVYDYQRDPEFAKFAVPALQYWPDLIDEDLEQAFKFSWRKLDFDQKELAVRRLNERIAEHEDPRFVKRLPKYLENGDYKRPVRKPHTNNGSKPEKTPAAAWKELPTYEEPNA